MGKILKTLHSGAIDQILRESKSGQLWRAKAERLLGKEEVYFMPYL